MILGCPWLISTGFAVIPVLVVHVFLVVVAVLVFIFPIPMLVVLMMIILKLVPAITYDLLSSASTAAG